MIKKIKKKEKKIIQNLAHLKKKKKTITQLEEARKSVITDTVTDSSGAEGSGVAELDCKPWGGIGTILLQLGKENN